MQEKRTLSGWANMQQIRLLDLKYYDDNNLYSYEEYRQIVPRNVEVPMPKPEMPEIGIIDINNFIVKKEDNYQLSNIVTSELKMIEEEKKELIRKEKTIREKLLKEMEEKNISKIETDDISITYKAPTERETFRTKDFKKDLPDLYDTYIEFTPVKSSLLIKIK
jgi:hypothetical protein